MKKIAPQNFASPQLDPLRPQVNGVKRRGQKVVAPELMEAAKGMEKIFVKKLIDEMRKSVPTQDGGITDSHAERVYRSLLDDEYAQTMVDQGGIGLSHLIIEALTNRR